MTNQALSGAASGAATGAAVGSVIPGIGTAIGAVAGAVIGGIGGAGADAASRDVFRAQRADEARRNEALLVQADRTAESGARLASAQRTAFAGAGIAGATPASVQLDTAFQTYRDQLALLAGISNNFQGRTPKSIGQKLSDEASRTGGRLEKEAKRILEDYISVFEDIF